MTPVSEPRAISAEYCEVARHLHCIISTLEDCGCIRGISAVLLVFCTLIVYSQNPRIYGTVIKLDCCDTHEGTEIVTVLMSCSYALT